MPIFKDKNTPSPFIEDFAALGDDGEGSDSIGLRNLRMDKVSDCN